MEPISIITVLFSAAEGLINLAHKYREARQQSGEWTPEQEAQYKADRDKLLELPQWKVRP